MKRIKSWHNATHLLVEKKITRVGTPIGGTPAKRWLKKCSLDPVLALPADRGNYVLLITPL